MNTLETSVAQLKGLAKRFTGNRHSDIDAVEIETEKGPIDLHFPPHMAKMVMEAVTIGQQVTADYIEKIKPEKKPKLELKVINADNQTGTLAVEDHKPKKPSDNSSVETIKPEKFTLVCDKKDEPVGIRVDDKLIHLHKEDKELAAAIRPDSTLTIQAVLRTDKGFVNEHNLSVYHIKSIDIDGRSFQPSKKK